MFIDYAMFPPELNSARMYTGPGAGSLLSAAASWEGLSTDLQTTAETYRSVIAGLTTSQWLGPSSIAVAAAVAPYATWLTATAAQARQTASQATAAVGAYEQAFAMTVPPPEITANRSQLLALVATNFFGQNTSAIAATEANYAEMWAQDATAMYDYATTSASAASLTPFSSPKQTTNPAGLTAQGAAVSHATASPAASVSSTLTSLVQPAASGTTGSNSIFSAISGAFPLVKEDFTVLDGILATYGAFASTSNVFQMVTGTVQAEKALGWLPAPAATVSSPVLANATPAGLVGSLDALGNAVSRAGLMPGGAASVAVGNAGRIGPLSVPAVWSAPAVASAARTFEATPMLPVPAANGTVPGMPGMPGASSAAAASGGRNGLLPRYGLKVTVMSQPFTGG